MVKKNGSFAHAQAQGGYSEHKRSLFSLFKVKGNWTDSDWHFVSTGFTSYKIQTRPTQLHQTESPGGKKNPFNIKDQHRFLFKASFYN